MVLLMHNPVYLIQVCIIRVLEVVLTNIRLQILIELDKREVMDH